MRFTELDVKGAVLIELEARRDARGFFARAFCAREFRAAGLNPSIVQSILAVTDRWGTTRGLNYRVASALEASVCRCPRGNGPRRACAVAMTADPAGRRCGGGPVSTASFGSDGQDP